MRGLSICMLALGFVGVGCGYQKPLTDDFLVHSDRPGYKAAYGHERREYSPDPTAVRFPAVKLPAGARLVDLTHAFEADTIYWPTDKSGFLLQELAAGKTTGGWYYAANKFSAPEHGGTHIDAPIHFFEHGMTVDVVPLARLVAPAAVIDMRVAAEAEPDALLEVAAIEKYEATYGPIRAGTIVLVRTGWASRWPDRKRYLGDDRPGVVASLHFPGISEAAAEALVRRKVAAVGIDTASIDHGPSKEFLAHRTLAAADIPALENVTHLELLPPRGALVFALPMKIRGGTGAPLRIVAVVPGAAKTAQR